MDMLSHLPKNDILTLLPNMNYSVMWNDSDINLFTHGLSNIIASFQNKTFANLSSEIKLLNHLVEISKNELSTSSYNNNYTTVNSVKNSEDYNNYKQKISTEKLSKKEKRRKRSRKRIYNTQIRTRIHPNFYKSRIKRPRQPSNQVSLRPKLPQIGIPFARRGSINMK